MCTVAVLPVTFGVLAANPAVRGERRAEVWPAPPRTRPSRGPPDDGGSALSRPRRLERRPGAPDHPDALRQALQRGPALVDDERDPPAAQRQVVDLQPAVPLGPGRGEPDLVPR